MPLLGEMRDFTQLRLGVVFIAAHFQELAASSGSNLEESPQPGRVPLTWREQHGQEVSWASCSSSFPSLPMTFHELG